jgi:hypothetical protein
MKKRNLFSPQGNRKQASVSDAEHIKNIMVMPPALKFGRIKDVYAFDNPKNKVGKYTTYVVILSPEGIVAEDVPSCYGGGHYQDNITPTTNTLQNTEETSLVIGQPVLVGFVNNSNLNPVIICPVGCQVNNGAQTTAQYPQKSGSFQGLKWNVDNAGNPKVTVPASGNLTVLVGGTVLLTIQNGLVQIGNGVDVGVLGNALVAYLNTHTHTGGTIAGLTGPPVVPATGITTSILKVQ